MQYAAASHGEFEGDSKEIRRRFGRGFEEDLVEALHHEPDLRNVAGEAPQQRIVLRNGPGTIKKRPRNGLESVKKMAAAAAASAGRRQQQQVLSRTKTFTVFENHLSAPACLRARLPVS